MRNHFWNIIKESTAIIIFASLISTLGGIGLEALFDKNIVLLPIIILIPALNDLIGSFGTIIASRFTTMLFKKEVHEKNWWHQPKLYHLFFLPIGIAVFASVYVALLAYGISMIQGFPFDKIMIQKIIFIAMIITITLVSILFFVSIIGGFYVYKKKHDPDNYLIPLTTAIGDFGSMMLLALIVAWLF